MHLTGFSTEQKALSQKLRSGTVSRCWHVGVSPEAEHAVK